MKSRLALLTLPVAAGAAFLATAGAGLADSQMFSGTINGDGCGAAMPIHVTAPARIDTDVATSAPGGIVFTQVLGAGGAVLADQTASYNAAPGTYAVRVCARRDPRDGDVIPYTGIVTLAAISQDSAPTTVTVAGVSASVRTSAIGTGVVRTKTGLATFSVRAIRDGKVSVRYVDKLSHVNVAMTNLAATFGTNTVTIVGPGLRMVLVDRGTRDSLSIRAGAYRASGAVVRGSVLIA